MLNADEDCEIEADIRDYTSIDVWLNGEKIYTDTTCAYSPMRRHAVTMKLRKGGNLLFLRAQNSCTRDTRNIVAVSFPDKPAITVSYPGEETDELKKAECIAQWLSSVRYDGKSFLTAPEPPPFPISFGNPSMAEQKWTDGAFYPISDKRGFISVTLRAETRN